ncbi:MFS domain-containing protein [Aphelenchoides besseyi]|nr:MFS domain-containing protein [Aphelenchoides besseyi]
MSGKNQQLYDGVTDWKSIYYVAFFSWIDAFQFSFFVWSFWPFVQTLDSTISPTFIGIIMGVSGLGEAIGAPLFGYWLNRSGRLKFPVITSFCISMVANLSYAGLNAVPIELMSFAILVSRFLAGAGSGNRGCFLAYTASASTKSDRTKSMALTGGGALIGLTAGPAVQGLFTWLKEGVSVGPFRLSMYSAPAILAFFINVLCAILLPIVLDDRLDNRGKEEDTISKLDVTVETDHESLEDCECQNPLLTVRPDVLAILICMLTRAARMLVTANVESIGSPYSQIMFGFNDAEVLNYNSASQAAIGALTTLMLVIYAFTHYSNWISERLNCIIAMIALLGFHLLTFSYPFLPNAPLNCPLNSNNETVYSWCDDLRPTNVYVYYISYILVFGLALPCLNNSLQSLYSLVLGNSRQGLMQGLNQSVGSLSRIFGPILISSTFTSFGPLATWTVEIVTLTLFLCIWLVAYRRLVPANENPKNKIVPVDCSLDFSSKSSSVSL